MSRGYPVVYISGTNIDLGMLEVITVVQRLNQHSQCTVIFRTLSDNRFDLEETMGSDIKVVGVAESGDKTTVFTGFISGGRIEYEASGSYTIEIEALSNSARMDWKSSERYWRKKSLSDVASAMAGENRIPIEVTASGSQQRNYVQWGESDFTFLRRIADDNSCFLRPSEKGLEVLDGFQATHDLKFRGDFGDGLVSFEVRARVSHQTMGGVHYDYQAMTSQSFKLVQGDSSFTGASSSLVDAIRQASQKLVAPGYVDLDSRAPRAADYTKLLKREATRSVAAGIVASGSSRTETLVPGDKVEISGNLDAGGVYGLTEVIHTFTPDAGYENSFRCTPDMKWLDPEVPEPVRILGAVAARVMGNNDPRKIGRIQVSYDWLEGGQTGWIRMTTPHAGGDRGFLFLPEIGDEVLVVFEHGDPERPVALGCLWNGTDAAPRQEFWGGDVDANEIKRIVTKSGVRIQLSDKQGQEAVVVATPKKLKLSLLEKAEETGRPMILLHAEEGDILLSAPNGRIHFHSSQFSRETGS